MADQTIDDAVAFPQDDGTGVADGSEDYNSAGYLGLLAEWTGGSYVGGGLTFNQVDTTNEQVDVDAGHAFITEGGNSVQSGSQTTYDTTLPSTSDMTYVVVMPTEEADLNLDSDTDNDLWLAVNPGSNDDVYIRHGSGLSAPSDPHVKLGTVHTGDGTTTRANDTAVFDVSDSGTLKVRDPTNINFGTSLSVTDDGDGTMTVDASSSGVTTDSATKSGDGTTTTFTLSHSLGSTPSYANVVPTSEDASTDFWVSNKTSSDVDITYAAAPPSGTDNLTYDIGTS